MPCEVYMVGSSSTFMKEAGVGSTGALQKAVGGWLHRAATDHRCLVLPGLGCAKRASKDMEGRGAKGEGEREERGTSRGGGGDGGVITGSSLFKKRSCKAGERFGEGPRVENTASTSVQALGI